MVVGSSPKQWSRLLPRLDARFYHVGNGKVLAKTAEDIELEIPTLSEVPVDLAKWSLSLT